MSGHFRTLIIDNERAARENLYALMKNNFPFFDEVDFAGEAEEAIRKIDLLQPDLVFMDMRLKKGTAFDILSGITHKQFLLILLIDPHEQFIDAVQSAEVDYLIKPVRIQELENVVLKYVEKEKIRDTADKIRALLRNVKKQDTAQKRRRE